MRRRPALVFLAMIGAAAIAVAAQNAATPQAPTFRGGANVVRVDLYATRDGKAVEDLQAGDVEVLEDGVRQAVDSFEFVRVRPPVAQELRAEPSNVEASRQMASDPRARIFVIFLDTYHTQIEGSAQMRRPLLNFVDRVVGQDDLVALMTPEMSAADVTLGRKTTVVSRLLEQRWDWGRRGRLVDDDPVERLYDACFFGADAAIATEMKARRRERLTLDAIDDLIVHFGGLRDERKAVLVVTEGWIGYGPNPVLARATDNDRGRLPPPPGIVDRGVPRNGDRGSVGGGGQCDADRVALANMDHTFRLQTATERANRFNVSFYPVYARGLAVFDAPIGPDPPPTLAQDAANLRERQNGLRLLAENTDGVAVVNTNNIDQALRRIVDDLSSYYLIGYSSTNTKLDGKFRRISVRVSRPGVQTRARRGYRALTEAELSRGVPGGSTPASTAPANPVIAALNAMAFNPRAQLRLRSAAWMAQTAGAPAGAFWLAGTLDDAVRRDPAWAGGGTVDVAVRAGDGRTVFSTSVPLTALDGGFSVLVPEGAGLPAGEYAVRARVRSTGGAATLDEAARVIVPGETPIGEAVLLRRRPSTGPAYLRSADPRVARADRLRLEVPVLVGGDAVATLLDRAGKPIAVPLQVSTRDDAVSGVRWVVVETAIAPLAPGDYAIDVVVGAARRVTAFRVVP